MASRWLQRLHRVEDALLAALLLGLILLSTLQIGLRMLFETGLIWAEPLSRAGVLWLALLGALGATREHRHIALDALPRLMPPLPRRIAWSLGQAGAAIVTGLLAWYSVGLVGLELEAPAVFIGRVPSWVPMLALPFGFGLMAARFVLAAFAPAPPLLEPLA